MSALLQWTRVRSACFREPALLTSITSYLTYKHTDLSGLAENFPPLENNMGAENPFMGEWERNGSSDNGGCGVGGLVCQQHDVCLCRWANRKAETTAARLTWLCSVCQLCWLRVTPGTLAAQPQPRKGWVAAEHPLIFNADDDARGKMSSWSLFQAASARLVKEEKEWFTGRGEGVVGREERVRRKKGRVGRRGARDGMKWELIENRCRVDTRYEEEKEKQWRRVGRGQEEKNRNDEEKEENVQEKNERKGGKKRITRSWIRRKRRRKRRRKEQLCGQQGGAAGSSKVRSSLAGSLS